MAWTLEEIQKKRKEVEEKKAAMKNRSGLVSADAVGKNVLSGMTLSAAQSADGGVARRTPFCRDATSSPDRGKSFLKGGAKNQGSITGEPSVEEGKGTAALGVRRGTSLTGAQELLERTLSAAQSADGGVARSSPEGRAKNQGSVTGKSSGEEAGWYGQAVQKLEESLSARREEEQFDKLNAWMEQEGNRELVRLIRTGKNVTPYAAESHAMQPVSVSGAALSAASPLTASVPLTRAQSGALPEGEPSVEETPSVSASADSSLREGAYSDAELIAKGYTQQQIDEARQYIAEFDALPTWKRAAQRTSDTIEGIGSTVAAAIPLASEYLGQSVWNLAGTQGNLQTLWQELEGDNRARALYAYLNGTDVDGNAYTDEAIQSMGYTQSEIDQMRARIQGSYVTDGIAPEESVGYQLYKHGAGMNELAQRGLSDVGKAAQGVVSSAAENLAVSAINPALVLPVLSAQGGAEALGQSVEKGEDAGKALTGGLAKFAAGWGINSVGAAQLAHAMGSDYAKDTLAGQIAKWVRELAGEGSLAANYPTIANALSGGVDNAMQAFVETYADMAIDALLGDDEQAAALFEPETFITALQSGLSGGASGALGGAVGTQLARVYDGETSFAAVREKLLQSGDGMPSQQRNQPAAELLATLPEGEPSVAETPSVSPFGLDSSLKEGALRPHQSPAVTASPDRGKPLAETMTVREETAVNDDPASHTPAQNESIAQYKDSVDVKLAEYVDRVRAGEELAPYVVSETSDRMRNAMMELTGLDKVGDQTLMDANAVKHITNRHAGGDGSADGTMKSSADVARAAYVLNNFDNAYLSTRKADGYFDSKGKRAPIVIFEKKIDGSHVVVEAVTDTKKSRNYIVTEYLSKNGVEEKEIAKVLQAPMSAVADPEVYVQNVLTDPSAMASTPQPPMSAVADPEVHVRNVTEDYDATTNIAPGGEGVKGENGTQTEYADLELRAKAQELDTTSWNRAEQMDAAQQLVSGARMSSKGVQTVVNNMPQGVGAEIYAPAASSLYRLGVVEDVATFEEALRLTGKGGMSGRVQQVLALGEAGRAALKIAYLQGKGEAEQYRASKLSQRSSQKQEAVLNKEAGTYTKNGKVSSGKNARDALIELTAKGTGVAAEQKVQLRGNAKGEIQTALGRVFYRADADTATILHETLHEVNGWSAQTGQELIDTFHRYLVQQNGMESVQELVQGYLDRYERAGQALSYNQAMEEVTADAMETIFGTEESFRQFLRLQASEAKMNAAAQKRTNRVMEKIGTLLKRVLSDIKSLLVKEPTNAAARAAKSLTEQQLRDLQDLYFAHQIEAGANYRAALEAVDGMKNATSTESTAAESRYQIDEDFASEIDKLGTDTRWSKRIRVGSTSEVLKSIGVKDQSIYWDGRKIQKILEKHSEKNFRAGVDNSVVTKEIIKQVPQVLENPIIVLHSDTSQSADYASRIYMFGEVYDATGKPLDVSLELLPTSRKGVELDSIVITSAYGKKNVQGLLNRDEILYIDKNKKRTDTWLAVNRLQLPLRITRYGSIASLHYEEGDVKSVTVDNHGSRMNIQIAQ